MKGITVFLFLFIFSCANHNQKEELTVVQDSNLLKYESEFENFTLEKLAAEKLQGYFELLKLKEEHPEFKTDILLQLEELSKGEFVKIDSLDNLSIENIRSAGPIIKLSDSVQRLKLYYDIISLNQNKMDSIGTLITSKEVVFGGQKTLSTKIRFISLN